MSETRTVRLGSLIKPAGKRAGENSELPVYSVTKHQGFVPSLEYFKKQVFSRETKSYKVVEQGQFAYATIHLDEGSIGIAPEKCIISPMYTVFEVASEEVIPEYLLLYLKGPRAMATYPLLGQGAIERRMTISLKSLSTLEIQLPPLEQQEREVKSYQLQTTIAKKRERQQELFKELKSSLFQSIIEDENETVNLGDVASFIGGSSLPTGEPFTGQEGGVLLMKVSDMNTPGNNNEIHHTSLWVSEYGNNNQIVPAGSVVIPKRGASIATNKKRLITRPTVLDPNLMAIIPKSEKLSSQFLYHWFLQFDLTSITSGSSVPQLNKKDLSPLEISIPSFQHQINFARIIDTIKY